MIFEMPVKMSGLGAVTTDAIEREIERRGIYVEAPYTVETPVALDEPPVEFVEPLPWLPEEPPVPGVRRIPYPGDDYFRRFILPVEIDYEIPEVTPTDVLPPTLPHVTEPELTEVYSPPYTEEDFPMTRIRVPEREPPSKVALYVAISILALAALTNGRKGKT